MRIRPETAGDVAAIAVLIEAAFGRPAEARLVERLRALSTFDSRLSIVAEADARIVGHILFTPIRIRGDAIDSTALALAPVAVDPERQRTGIGTTLIRDGLERCAAFGHRVVVVLGDPGYYGRFGFTPASRFAVKAPFPVPDEAFMLISLGQTADIAGAVEYPPPFADLD